MMIGRGRKSVKAECRSRGMVHAGGAIGNAFLDVILPA
jgi:hypothetical protein